jgi:hypothetical protein
MSDLEDIVIAPVDAVQTVTGATSEAVQHATDEANHLLHQTVGQLADTLRVSSEAHSSGLAGLSDRIAALESRVVTLVESGLVDAGDVAEAAADAVADAPDAVADEVEAVIESADGPPTVKKRGMIGAMKKNGRKR